MSRFQDMPYVLAYLVRSLLHWAHWELPEKSYLYRLYLYSVKEKKRLQSLCETQMITVLSIRLKKSLWWRLSSLEQTKDFCLWRCLLSVANTNNFMHKWWKNQTPYCWDLYLGNETLPIIITIFSSCSSSNIINNNNNKF